MEDYKRFEVPDGLPKGAQFTEQLEEAEKEIAKYDYIGIKIAMGVATKKEYAEEITYTESIRQVIREIEQDIEKLSEEEE